MQIPFVGPSYTTRNVSADCQRTINLYVDFNEIEIPNGEFNKKHYLVSTPGLKNYITPLYSTPNNEIRAMIVTGMDNFYIVCGFALIEIKFDAQLQEPYQRVIGNLITENGRVSMADNGFQLVMTDGEYYYVYNYSTDGSFSQVTPEAWEDIGFCNDITYFETYFVYTQKNSQKFYLSGVYDGMTIDALEYASAEGSPDNLVASLSNRKNLYLFGEKTTEILYNAGVETGRTDGSTQFPLLPMSGGHIKIGCMARGSIAIVNDNPIFIGRDDNGSGIVYMLNSAGGYTPQRISNFAVEYSIQNSGDISDSTSFTYQDEGHFFYCLNVPGAGTTWCYDLTTSMWHERQYFNSKISQAERHRAEYHVYWQGKHLVSDYKTNKIYEMSLDYYDDDGDDIQKIRISPHDDGAELERLSFSEFQLNIDVGSKYDINPNRIPKILLSYSNDGAKTWSQPLAKNLWQQGQYIYRLIWRRLGASRKRVWKIMISDPVRVVILGAKIMKEKAIQ